MAQTALVTGGTGGLGTAVTRAFLDSGRRVVVPSSRAGEGLLEPHERLELLRADVTTPDGAARAVAAADEGLGAVVNLVGGYAAGGRVHETPVEDFEAIDTPANRAAMPDADHASWPKPEAIAHVIVFLCSDDAAATSGAHVPV